MHHVLATHYNASGKSERTVEPCRHDWSTVNLGIELHDAALAEHLGIGLDAERGRVAMGANHVEASLSHWFAANAEGEDRRVVLGDEETVAGIYGSERLTWVELAETTSYEHVRDIFNCQEIHW